LNAFNLEVQVKMADPNASERLRTRGLLIWGAGVGLAYGLAIRLAARLLGGDHSVMTVGFIFFMPLALGFLAVFFAEMKQAQRLWICVLLPWVPLAAALVAMYLAVLEGLICVVMFAPIGLVLASIGGLLGGLAGRFLRTRRSKGLTVACVAVFPFFMVPCEGQVFYHLEMRQVENVVDIHAPAAVVWRNIERVPPIHKDELPPSWSRRIGFPDPIEATLSHERVGGVREASFAGGVLFIETVDTWEPERRLAFSIRADRIPKETLDEHVTVGGPYFDVLRGEYRLEPLANGITRVHLSSQHRISTDFNWYAHLWTDAVMWDLQKNILFVVRRRCEKAANVKRD
jgi:hypothetical protein